MDLVFNRFAFLESRNPMKSIFSHVFFVVSSLIGLVNYAQAARLVCLFLDLQILIWLGCQMEPQRLLEIRPQTNPHCWLLV